MTLHNTTLTNLSAGQPAAALQLLTEHLERDPSDVRAWEAAAHALLALGRPDEAAAAAAQASRRSGAMEARALWAVATAEAGQSTESIDHIATVLDQHPADAGVWELLARAFEALGEIEAGLEARREAVRRAPRVHAIALRLAERSERADHRDEARAVVDQVLGSGPNTVAERILVRLDHHDGKLDEAASRARRILAQVPHRALWMELARIEAGRGRAAAAWDAACRGNALALRSYVADGGDLDSLPRALANRAAMPVGPFPSGKVDGAAFVVGFPRSGTTLLQQVLHSHPGIHTLEELPLVDRAVDEVLPGSELASAQLAAADPETATRLREAWWRAVRRRNPPPDALVVDKLPLNLLRVELLAHMFPGAPMVVMVRDPRDVVLSALFQDFEPNAAMAQFADPMRCAQLYAAAFSRWMAVRSAMPQAIEVRYETMVADPESTMRRVLTHLGVPWNDTVLNHVPTARQVGIDTPSYRNVREPMYTRSIGRWRAYADLLAPVMPVLAPFVEAFGYPTR